MARPRKLKPSYCRHKPSGRAFVTLNGHRIYLGDFDTQASRDEYDRVVGEWITAGRQQSPAADVAANDAADQSVVPGEGRVEAGLRECAQIGVLRVARGGGVTNRQPRSDVSRA